MHALTFYSRDVNTQPWPNLRKLMLHHVITQRVAFSAALFAWLSKCPALQKLHVFVGTVVGGALLETSYNPFFIEVDFDFDSDAFIALSKPPVVALHFVGTDASDSLTRVPFRLTSTSAAVLKSFASSLTELSGVRLDNEACTAVASALPKLTLLEAAELDDLSAEAVCALSRLPLVSLRELLASSWPRFPQRPLRLFTSTSSS